MTKLKIVAIAVVLVGIVGIGYSFIGLTLVELEREQYIIHSNSGLSSSFSETQILEANHYYEIVVTMEDDSDYYSYGYEATVEGSVMFYLDGAVMLNENLYDYEYRDEEESTGVDAIDSAYYDFTPTSSVNVTIIITMTQGDEWSIIIYQDVPPEIDEKSTIQLIILISGFIIFIIGLVLFIKVRQSA